MPFTREAVPQVDLQAGRVVVRPLEPAEDSEEGEEAGADHGR